MERRPAPGGAPRATPPPIDLTLSGTDTDDEFEDVDVPASVDAAPNVYASLYDAADDAARASGSDEPDAGAASAPPPSSLHITVAHARAKRQATSTPLDRKRRYLVHQIHVLALLAASRHRNRWCNDPALREALLGMVPELLLRQLQGIHPKLVPERRERVRMMEAFLHELVQWWHARFRIDAACAAAAAWRQPSSDLWQPTPAPAPSYIDGWVAETPAARQRRHQQQRGAARPMELAVFPTGEGTSVPTYLRYVPPRERVGSPAQLRRAALRRLGSRETKALLFCALCRALGVPARLVVSLQVTACTASKAPPTRPPPAAPSATRDDDLYIEPLDSKTPPTMWVEAYSKPYQHWLTIDPVRGFVKATGLRNMEPLPSQRQNKMVYVVAWEEDGYARDVTPRYTRAMYGRVARLRPSGRGDDWWARVVRAIHRPQALDRDAIEDVELQDCLRREPMPTSTAGFKDHPVFVLERHLHQNQVLHPAHRVGTFQGQPVYLRANVVKVQSARQWYNVGREVKKNEIPLKWAKQRAYTTTSKRLEEQARAQGHDDAMEALFAEFQTQLYVPPPVVDGVLPRNAFGNIDLFVPSMLPQGAAHIPHALAARAAKQLGVPYGDAVVAFEFKKFRSLPVIRGVVVPSEHADMVTEAVRELEATEAQNAAHRVQQRAFKNWAKLLKALVVARRVHDEYSTITHAPPTPQRHDASAAAAAAAAPSETRQLLDLPEPEGRAPSAPPPPASPPPPSAPIPERAPRARGPIVSLDEMIAQDRAPTAPRSAPSAPPKKRRIVLKRAPAPRRSARSTRARPVYRDSSDSDAYEDAAEASDSSGPTA